MSDDPLILKEKIKNQREELYLLHEIIARQKHEKEILKMALSMASSLPDDWIKRARTRFPRKIMVCGSIEKKVDELENRESIA